MPPCDTTVVAHIFLLQALGHCSAAKRRQQTSGASSDGQASVIVHSSVLERFKLRLMECCSHGSTGGLMVPVLVTT